MTQVVPEARIAFTDDRMPVKRWGFYAFVVQAFLLIGAVAVILGLTWRLAPLFMPVFAGSMFVVIALITLPVLSAVSRLYYRQDIDIGATILWSIATALLVGTIMLFAVH